MVSLESDNNSNSKSDNNSNGVNNSSGSGGRSQKPNYGITHDSVVHVYGCYLFIFIFSLILCLFLYTDEEKKNLMIPMLIAALLWVCFTFAESLVILCFSHHTHIIKHIAHVYWFCEYVGTYTFAWCPFYVALRRLTFQYCADILYMSGSFFH